MLQVLKAALIGLFALSIGCRDDEDLAESSFGPLGQASSKASPASVISMGRDDDDGKAKKWHIGGVKTED